MTTKAFVTACRGDEGTMDLISPLSYVKDAIRGMKDLETAIKERDDDPGSYWGRSMNWRSCTET